MPLAERNENNRERNALKVNENKNKIGNKDR